MPQNWREVRLKDIGKAVIGLTYDPLSVTTAEGTLVLRSSNIRDYHIDYEDQVKVSIPVSDKNIVKEGDILICARNGSRDLIGKNAYIERRDAGHAFGAFMSVFRSENNRYLKYLFQTSLFKQQIKKGLGPTINQLTTGHLHAFKFPFPPQSEQNRIIAVLETWDKVIDKLERKISLKRKVKSKLLQNLLTGKTRLPGFEDEWKTVKMSDIFERIRRTTKNTDSIKSYSISSKVGFELQENKYNRVMSGSSLKKYTHLLKGEFSYNKGNSLTYPYGCIYLFEENEGLVPFVYISFRNKGKVDSEFYKQYFLHGLLEKQLKALITSGVRGNGLLNVAAKDFFQCTVLCPPFKEQVAIGKTLEIADRELNLLEKKMGKFKQQKAYLLAYLITGRIRTPENMPISKS